jgi:hypothetical protein
MTGGRTRAQNNLKLVFSEFHKTCVTQSAEATSSNEREATAAALRRASARRARVLSCAPSQAAVDAIWGGGRRSKRNGLKRRWRSWRREIFGATNY